MTWVVYMCPYYSRLSLIRQQKFGFNFLIHLATLSLIWYVLAVYSVWGFNHGFFMPSFCKSLAYLWNLTCLIVTTLVLVKMVLSLWISWTVAYLWSFVSFLQFEQESGWVKNLLSCSFHWDVLLYPTIVCLPVNEKSAVKFKDAIMYVIYFIDLSAFGILSLPFPSFE